MPSHRLVEIALVTAPDLAVEMAGRYQHCFYGGALAAVQAAARGGAFFRRASLAASWEARLEPSGVPRLPETTVVLDAGHKSHARALMREPDQCNRFLTPR